MYDASVNGAPTNLAQPHKCSISCWRPFVLPEIAFYTVAFIAPDEDSIRSHRPSP